MNIAGYRGTAEDMSPSPVFDPTIVLEFEDIGTHAARLVTCTTVLSYTFPGQTNFVAGLTDLIFGQYRFVAAQSISATSITNSDYVALTTASSYPSPTTTLITLTNPSAVTITEVSLAYWTGLSYPTPEQLHLPIPPGGSVSLLRDFYVGNPPPPDYEIPPTKVIAYGQP